MSKEQEAAKSRKIKSLQSKKILLKQTIQLEEEERDRDLVEQEEEKKERKKKEVTRDRVEFELVLWKEEAKRTELCNEFAKDVASSGGAIPKSMIKLNQEQSGTC